MFGQKQQAVTAPVDYQRTIQDLKHNHELELQKIKLDHELALKKKEFEMRHFKDDELKKALKDLRDKDQEIAVLKKENQMLEKITNLNADIIDIKDLVSNLIGKLPEIKLNNLTLNGSNKE
jgi:cell shape-determining protein MreC